MSEFLDYAMLGLAWQQQQLEQRHLRLQDRLRAEIQERLQKFNPSHSEQSINNPRKRAAEEESSGPALVLQELETKQDSLQVDVMSKVVPANPGWEMRVDQGGCLFLSALEDTDVHAGFKFFKVTGTFLVGTAATAFLAKEGAQSVPYNLTPESRVFVNLKPPEAGASSGPSGPDLQLPTSALTLQAVYKLLAAEDQGQIELQGHTVAYSPGSPEQMQVKADEDCCLQIMTSPASLAQGGKEIPLDKLSAAVSMMDLQACQVVHQLQYDQQLKKLKPMLPAVIPKNGFQIKAGNHYQL